MGKSATGYRPVSQIPNFAILAFHYKLWVGFDKYRAMRMICTKACKEGNFGVKDFHSFKGAQGPLYFPSGTS